VAEVLVENKPMPVLRVGIKDTYAESAANAHLLDKYGLSPERIAGSIESFTRRFAATLT
jgi:transketolase